MLIRAIKCTKLRVRPNFFPSPSPLSTLSLPSTPTTTTTTTTDTVHLASTLITKPKWEHNPYLKSLVSYMTPNAASDVINVLATNNYDQSNSLCVRFFNWVCRQSTYCYEIEGRISLLNSIVSKRLFGVAHSVVVALCRECRTSESDCRKLVHALYGLRKTGFRLNYPSYSSLLMCLAKANLGFVGFSVYKWMVGDGFVVGDIDYRSVINGLCKTGFVHGGLMFLCRVVKLGFCVDTHVCTSLVLGYCRQSELGEAFKVLEIMSMADGCGPNSVTYSTLIHGLCEAGMLEEAFRLKGEMGDKGCLPSTHTYTVLIKAVCDIGLTDDGLSLLDEMIVKGCKPNVHTFTVLVDGLCRAGKIEEADGIFRRMLQERLVPSVVTYNSLINGYCKESQIDSAFEILGLMERRRCRPNVRTYNELMGGLCRVGKSYKAMLLLSRMVNNGVSPDSVTCNILVDGLCREGEFDVAFGIFKSMESYGLKPDSLTLTALIDGLCKQGQSELASGVLGLMVKLGISADEIALTALMQGYCKIGKPRDALALFHWMMEGMHLKSCIGFNLCLYILCKESRLNEVFAMFGKMLKYAVVPSVVTYTLLVDALCRASNLIGSLYVLELMKRANCPPNVYTYTILIGGLCQNGRIEEAETLLFSMPDLGVSPDHVTYTVLVKAHANTGNLDRALEIMSTMVKCGCEPNKRVYSSLLMSFASSQNNNEVVHGYSRSIPSPTVDNDAEDDESIHDGVNLNIELALELGDKINAHGGSLTDFFDTLVISLIREGRSPEAYNLALEKLKGGLFLNKSVSAIIEWLCKESRFDDCLEFMKLITSIGFIPSFGSWGFAIRAFNNVGKSQEAQSLVCDLLRHNDIVEDQTVLLPYIGFLVKRDTLDLSLPVLNLIDQLHYRERPRF